MDSLSIGVLFAHILAVAILISVMPYQLQDILRERDKRLRKVCWILFLGNLCLSLGNILPILQPIFWGTTSELFFNELVSLFNAIIAIVLGSIGSVLYRSTRKTVPKLVDEIEKK